MQTEYITTTKLIASEGMILTDGTIYGKVIYLAEGQDKSSFYEITKDEYERIMEERREKEIDEFIVCVQEARSE